MNSPYTTVIEQVQKFSLDEIEELQALLQKYVIEGRRDEVFANYLKTKNEESTGKLFTSKNNSELLTLLEQ